PPNGTPDGSGATQKSAVKPLSKELSKAPAPNPKAAGTGTPTSTAESPTAIINRWIGTLSDPNANTQDAANALAAIAALPKLSGRDESNATYAQMIAYGLQGNDIQMCKAANEVATSDANETHVLTAKNAIEARQCK
ncbi:MAG: hypothetical protein ACREN6_10090, partial [Gemmatimonadaceae bacterium]